MSSESRFSKKESIGLILLALLAMTITTVAVIPSLRHQVRELFKPESRAILAKVSGNVGPQGPRITVLKIRDPQGLVLEVYKQSEEEGLLSLAKIKLSEKRDGYITVQGNATNLALLDVDQDGLMEIVAPSYDEQMVPRLNVFKYNPATESFDRVNAPENMKF